MPQARTDQTYADHGFKATHLTGTLNLKPAPGGSVHGTVWVSILGPPAQPLAFCSAPALVTAPNGPGRSLNCSYQ